MAGVMETPPLTVQFSQSNTQGSTGRVTRKTQGRTRRYAPYPKTPTTRNLRSAKKQTVATGAVTRGAGTRTPPSASRQTTETNTAKELVNKTWRVYRVSPLYKFSNKLTDLKLYSRALSARLQADAQKGLAFETESVRADLALFSIYKGLKHPAGESEAIQINLKQLPKKGGGEARVVLTAVLCCLLPPDCISLKVAAPFMLLPVMLVRGPQNLTRVLTAWLQNEFDCVMYPILFPPISLNWMVAMWAGSTKEKNNHAVELKYRMPAEVEGLTYITLDINADDCKALWKCIHTSESESFSEDEVTVFIKALETHFYHHFKVNISAMYLDKVGTAIAYVGSEGKLKIFSMDHVHQVLGHVTELVLEKTLQQKLL